MPELRDTPKVQDALKKLIAAFPEKEVNDRETKEMLVKLSYAFYIVHLPDVVLCQYFISLTGMGEIYNFVLSFVISVIITCGICFFISKIAIVGIFRGEKISF